MELRAILKTNIKEQDLVRIIPKYVIALFTFLQSYLCLFKGHINIVLDVNKF
jgi:hypothetical protein